MTCVSRAVGALCVCFLFGFATTRQAEAQIVASELASIAQTIDGTELTVKYSRPSLRGREHVFGDEVPDSILWTPGADWATTLEASKDITLEGVSVPAGVYTIWMVTSRGAWDVVLDPRDKLFHALHPARSDSQIVFSVMPDTTAPLVESLQFTFPSVTSTGADLRMQWERTSVTMKITVPPTKVLTVTPEQAAPYLGRYSAHVPEKEEWDMEAFSFEFDLAQHGEYLGGEMQLFSADFPPQVMYFAEVAQQVFSPVFTINGSVAAVWDELYFEFVLDENGKAVSFEARDGEDDSLMMKGQRVDLP
ncbi:MAG: hypothetical protein ACI9BV_004006 [Rhodothermales bacterium]|jgi:hypothetical protein